MWMAQQGHQGVTARAQLEAGVAGGRREGYQGSGLCSFIHLPNVQMPTHTGESNTHQTPSCPQEPVGMNCCFTLRVHWLP